VPLQSQHSTLESGLILSMIGRVLKAKSFIGILLLGLLLSGARAYTSRPIYRSEIVLLYEDRGGSNPLATRDAPSARRIGLTLQEMLFSHALLEKLIREFGLYADMVAHWGMVAAVEEIQKQDLRFNAREGSTFRISFESTSPDLAQVVTTRAAELLTRAHVDARVQEVKETERFLDGERARAEKELRSHESELELFVAQHPEVIERDALRGGALSPDSSESASLGLEMQALQLRERLTQLRQHPSQPFDTARPGSPREANETRLRAEAELATAQRELVEKQAQFTEEYPDVKRAVARVASAKAYLRHLDESPTPTGSHPVVAPAPGAAAPSSGDQPEASVVKEQLELLEKQVRAARSHSHSSQPRSGTTSDPVALGRLRAQYSELERNVRESRDHHDLLENRQFQAEMQSVFTTQAKRGDLVVVDPAYKPVIPVRSPRSKIAAKGAAGSLFFALAVSLVLVFRDDRLRRAADLRRFSLPALLCEVPPP
jgi:uncharacterized protein involved in exopolysaccharide biosynthesis